MQDTMTLFTGQACAWYVSGDHETWYIGVGAKAASKQGEGGWRDAAAAELPKHALTLSTVHWLTQVGVDCRV